MVPRLWHRAWRNRKIRCLTPILSIAARSILFGWATLLAIAFLVERPLLIWTAPLLGATWFPTARLVLDCGVLTATGWVVGRLNRSRPMFAVLVFAATLTFWDFSLVVPINVPWLFQLTADAFGDPLYLESLATTAATHVFLFGSLIAGGLLSRPRRAPVSIVSGTLR